jgi:hypothetical protein
MHTETHNFCSVCVRFAILACDHIIHTHFLMVKGSNQERLAFLPPVRCSTGVWSENLGLPP